MKDTPDEVERLAIVGQKRVKTSLKALEAYMQADKDEKDTLEEHEEKLKEARDSQAWLEAEKEDYKEQLANVQVHLKGMFEGLSKEEETKWKAMKDAWRKRASTRFLVQLD